jgi:hypothetical protein
MPRFSLAKLNHNPPPDGVHLFKVTKVVERVSERTGFPLLVMTLETPDARRITSVLTFCEQAKGVITAVCRSAGLILPDDPDADVQLEAHHLEGRYIYATVISSPGDLLSDPEPRVVRFLSREQAIQKNPAIAEVPLRILPTIALPTVRRQGKEGS